MAAVAAALVVDRAVLEALDLTVSMFYQEALESRHLEVTKMTLKSQGWDMKMTRRCINC